MLNLFVLDTCPYCQKVMDFLDTKALTYHKFDIKFGDNLQKLLTIGGKEQVPFLFNDDTGDKLYESDEIIGYLKNLNG